jgi:hypothetical protein
MTTHNDPLHNSNHSPRDGERTSTDAALMSRLDETFNARSISGTGLTPPAAFLAGVARSRRARTVRRTALAIAALVVISGAIVYFSSSSLFAPAHDPRLNPDAGSPSRPIATNPNQSPDPEGLTPPRPEALAVNSRDPERLAEHSTARDADLMLLRVGDRQQVLSGGIALLR